MSARSEEVGARARELRRAFDLTFAAPPAVRASAEAVLALGIGGDTYALRLSEIGGVFGDRPVTPLPGRVPAFLGIAAIRGALVPVYSLAALLARPAEAAPRWLVLAGSRGKVGLAFDRLEGHFRGATTLATRAEERDGARHHVRATIALGERTVPLIDIGSVIQAIERAVPTAENEER